MPLGFCTICAYHALSGLGGFCTVGARGLGCVGSAVATSRVAAATPTADAWHTVAVQGSAVGAYAVDYGVDTSVEPLSFVCMETGEVLR